MLENFEKLDSLEEKTESSEEKMDSFSEEDKIQQPPLILSNCPLNEELKLFKKLENHEIEQEFKKCNKSNFIKNILNQFINFLNNEGDDVIIESLMSDKDRDIIQIRKEFQNFIRGKKPNASMLISFLRSKRFSPHLHYFLKYYSLDWMKQKQLKDKSSHLLCIDYLSRCYEEPELIDRIIKYKKKN